MDWAWYHDIFFANLPAKRFGESRYVGCFCARRESAGAVLGAAAPLPDPVQVLHPPMQASIPPPAVPDPTGSGSESGMESRESPMLPLSSVGQTPRASLTACHGKLAL